MNGAVPLLHDYLQDSAARHADRVALVCGGSRATYAELDRWSTQIACALLDRGVERGDRVVVFLDNSLEAVVSFWAVLKADAVVSVVSPQTKADKLAYLLNDCRARAIVTEARLLPPATEAARRTRHLVCALVAGRPDAISLEGLPRACGWERALAEQGRARLPQRRAIDVDLASIIYTSGTTGDAKGVMLTHRNMLTAATSVSTYLALREDDVILCALPLAFDYGLYQMIMAFRMGARLVLERSFAFPAQVLTTAVDEGVTVFPGVPMVFGMLTEMSALRRELDLTGIRVVTNTAAALSVKQIAAIREMFPRARVFSMFGLTECKRCTYLPPEDIDRKPSSVGIAIPNTELWLVDSEGRRLAPPCEGQLVIRGATVMKGYWEKPEETAKALIPGPLPGEMVLRTGDWCRQDAEGYLYFLARMDDVIKSRGEKVAPKEVETAIVDIRGVREAAVIGVPDELLGQAVKAFVVLEKDVEISARDVIRECQRRLEFHLVPKYVEFLPELPRSPNGKVRKQELQRLAGAAPARPSAERDASEPRPPARLLGALVSVWTALGELQGAAAALV